MLEASAPRLLTENEVIVAVNAALKARRWEIVSFATTAQAGIDIHATRGSETLYVEAKGVTSSKESSSRFGKVQSASQLFIQIAAALLKCAELKSASPTACVAMATPDHPGMRNRVARIEPTLKAADIGVLWVSDDGSVTGWNADWF
ncbi:MAG TPA: hypothetical protein VJP76_01530 [Candidatus Tumulicola sp.]|nr:hypothetical protein [Candidatus Tumulicola sp.]